MPWQEKRAMSLRQEFIALARQEGANVRALCRRYAISPKTAYKWLGRFEEGCLTALQDRSRPPLHHPALSPPSVEQAVVALRQEHPAWGGRKIARCLADQGLACVAPSTVTSILHRHGLIEPAASAQATPWKRFEHALPNSLWQLDFKGRFATLAGPCHALTILDDHSRFNLALFANARTDTSHVQPLLEQVFRRYGMPVRINADNGPPWGCSSGGDSGLSSLTLWLIQLGVRISHSRPYHPQTNGKLERFHRTLEREVLAGRHFVDHAAVQQSFDRWRDVYNCVRPHEALGLGTPAQRYQPSPVAFPEVLPSIDYADTDTVLRVDTSGFIRFKGRKLRVSQSLCRLPVGVRACAGEDGLFDLYFCHHRFMRLDMRELNTQT